MLPRPRIFQLTKLALIRNYEKFGGEKETRIPVFFIGLLMIFPLLSVLQLALLPASVSRELSMQVASHPGRNLVGAAWLFAPKILLYIPAHYWLFLSARAKESQALFNAAFSPIMHRNPRLWGLPFTICVALFCVLLVWPSLHYPLLAAATCVLMLGAGSIAISATLRRSSFPGPRDEA